MDKKQIIEFREKFCFKNFDGKKHYFSLRTNIDQTKEIEQWLSNKLDEIEEAIIEKARKSLNDDKFWSEENDFLVGSYERYLLELKNNK